MFMPQNDYLRYINNLKKNDTTKQILGDNICLHSITYPVVICIIRRINIQINISKLNETKQWRHKNSSTPGGNTLVTCQQHQTFAYLNSLQVHYISNKC